MISSSGFYRILLFVLMVFISSTPGMALVAESTPAGPSGTIHVDGEPVGMAISLDGIPSGNVPESGVLELVQIPAGGHLVGATLPGYEQKDTWITVLDGQTTKIRVQLMPFRTGTLNVQSVPPNVQVYLDDVYKGITPVTLTDVNTGDHMVLLKLPGYDDWSSQVTITPGGQQIISGTLERVSSAGAGQPAPGATQSGMLPGIVIIGVIMAILGISQIRR